MNRLRALLISMLLVGAAAVPAGLDAAAMTDEQLRIAASLSAGEKKALARQAGVDIDASQARGTGQDVAPVPPVTVEPAVVEKPAGPSSIEASMQRRLLNFSGPVAADRQFDDGAAADDRRHATINFINSDDRLQSAWGGKLSQRPTRTVNNELRQYGYNLFAGAPTTFAPATEIPIPPEYVLGPGDELLVRLYGSRDDSLTLVVDREGMIELPPVGPLSVAGQSFVQVKALIAEKIHQHIIGATGSVSMGRLRSIRVFVLGDVNHPGSYLVSGLSTISNALFVSGGVSRQGSLRHVILKRSGRQVAELDLYDFLLRGDSSNDLRLQPGDVVFVPPIGDVVGVAGEVVRPGIYELKKGESRSARDMLELAGGRLATADIRHVQVDRISAAGASSLLDMDLSARGDAALGNGDLMLVYPVPGIKAELVHLAGHVRRPGTFGLKEKMHLSDLIGSEQDLLPSAFLDYLIIQRADPASGEMTLLQPPLGRLLRDGYRSQDPELQPGDRVFVLSNKTMKPLTAVNIQGAVQMPGEYTLGGNMRIADLLMLAGGPQEDAYLKEAELTRYEIVDGEARQVTHRSVDLEDALRGGPHNLQLQPFDLLTVRQLSNWRAASYVTIEGEVRFPGTYPIEDGETLVHVIERAGGYTERAYLPGGVFMRQSIRERQQQELEDSIERMEESIAQAQVGITSLSNEEVIRDKEKGLAAARQLLERSKKTKAQGRLVIELASVEKMRESEFNMTLRDGDRLYIPKRPDQIMVLGQVLNSTAMLYRPGYEVDDYLDDVGGLGEMADADKIYVVKANGRVVRLSSSGWGRRVSVSPGDTIVVPERLDYFNLLDSSLNWSKVMAQLGVSIASMVAIGIL